MRTWEVILKGQQRDPILDIRKCLDKCHFHINKGKLIENVLINMAYDLEFPIASGDVEAHKSHKLGKEKIMTIARNHGIKTGLQATGNYGRGLLKPTVSVKIVEKFIPEDKRDDARTLLKLLRCVSYLMSLNDPTVEDI